MESRAGLSSLTTMSSLLPFLRQLLISPLKPEPEQEHKTRRAAGIHQIIQDRDRGGFTTPDRQQDHLSFHDTGLRGPQGALIVLEALATNPYASKLTLSHNLLGDAGIKQLASRIRFIKKRRTTPIHEVNLASNLLSDLALTELCRSWEGLSELYLSNNQITLTSTPSPLLTGLGNLTLLSLTSNPIDSASLSSLFGNPDLAPIHLTTLHLSACSLDLSVAVSLALWLEDRTRSGYLEWLAVNGNNWGTQGCQRIVWALARRGGNSNLLRLEMLACDTPTPDITTSVEAEQEDGQLEIDRLVKLLGFKNPTDLEDCRMAMENEGGWKRLLEKCETRNQALRLATRRAALGLVSNARHILLSNPCAPTPSITSSEQPTDGIVQEDSTRSSKDVFPWNRLPEELKLNIWRWVAILCAFPGLQEHHHFESNNGGSSNSPISSSPVDLPEPLTIHQLLNLIKYAGDRDSLQIGIALREEAIFNNDLLKSGSASASSLTVHRQLVDSLRKENEINRLGQKLILESCDCLRFLGDI
ncbi:hypothetical protein Pst134EA_005493 [Puccinia striiformis f. sp. tritici]|uniref:hypothetical protein n=1 Tax=Puccinia striiformis f. sp. tritici TaxID=168172 RepID=UPI002008C144|nr:hypothetical protein Pst134EA_005493 [Puccinia striiformis f. sp. tritici]KAH9471602.1 hypothetical protein Pst134EA_005493 [Puccinia striiformis f. sp. tritici]